MSPQRSIGTDVNAVRVRVLRGIRRVVIGVAVLEIGELEPGAVYAVAGAEPGLRSRLTNAAFEATPPVVVAAPGRRVSSGKIIPTFRLGTLQIARVLCCTVLRKPTCAVFFFMCCTEAAGQKKLLFELRLKSYLCAVASPEMRVSYV